MSDNRMSWSEADSRSFIDVGHVVTPSRSEIARTILTLMPDDPGQVVDLGIGAGWLSQAILERFPRAQVLGLDGSPTMLHEAEERLRPFAGRVELRPFRLEERAWREEMPYGVSAFVSSLVIHHLDGPGKQRLYHDLYRKLGDGGWLLIIDLVAPGSERERTYLAQEWNAVVREQSLDLTGSLDTFERFVAGRDNWYEYPDPVDTPSSVPEHLAWLEDAGFQGVNLFWERAGHAIYGGYRAEVLWPRTM